MRYEYQCTNCGGKFDEYRPSRKRKRAAACKLCGHAARYVPFANGEQIIGTHGSAFPGVCKTLYADKDVFIQDRNHYREECKRKSELDGAEIECVGM